jgi:hypothetical protein
MISLLSERKTPEILFLVSNTALVVAFVYPSETVFHLLFEKCARICRRFPDLSQIARSLSRFFGMTIGAVPGNLSLQSGGGESEYGVTF